MSRSVAVAIGLSTLVFAAYFPTICPTVYVGDPGELATAAATLGIAHPPGYPLWTLIGRVFVATIPGEPAYALNVFSAVAGALTAGLLAVLLHGLTGRWIVSMAAAAAFAFSRDVWGQATIGEVYSLNLLLTVGALTAAFAGARGRPRLFLLAAYLIGLGSANHPFVLLAGPPLLWLMFAGEEETTAKVRRLLPAAGLFALGLTTYLYLPLRLAHEPVMNWAGLRNFSDLIDHVTRAQYGGLGEAGADTSLGLRLRVFGAVLGRSVPVLVLLGSLAGIVALARARRRTEAVSLALFFLLAGPVVAGLIRYEDTFLDHSVIRVFFLPAVLAAFLGAGVALGIFDRWLGSKLESQPRVATLASGILALVAVGSFYQTNVAASDKSESTLARDYAQAILEELPENARLYAIGDNACFSLLYVHHLLNVRPDVTLMDRTLNVLVDEYGEDFAAMSRVDRRNTQVARERDLFFSGTNEPTFYTELIETVSFDGCRLVESGLVHQLLRPGERPFDIQHEPLTIPPIDTDEFLEVHLAGVSRYREGAFFQRVGREDEARASFAEGVEYARDIAAIARNLGLSYLDLNELGEAEKLFLRAVELEPENEDALYNLAILYGNTGRIDESIRYFERLITLQATYAEVFLNYGIQLAKAGRLPEAEAMAGRALSLESDLASAKDLVRLVARGRSIGGEAGVLEVRRELEGITAMGTLQLAQRYLNRGDVERATELYREAAKIAPDSPEAAYGLGFGLLKVGRFEDAAQSFRRIRELSPDNADSRNALAYVFSQLGDSLDVAERLAEEALELDPSRAAYWYDTLGWVRYRKGDLSGALDALQESEKLIPRDDLEMLGENDYHLGTVHAELGQLEEARRYLARSADRVTEAFWVPDRRIRAKRLGLEEAGS